MGCSEVLFKILYQLLSYVSLIKDQQWSVIRAFTQGCKHHYKLDFFEVLEAVVMPKWRKWSEMNDEKLLNSDFSIYYVSADYFYCTSEYYF